MIVVGLTGSIGMGKSAVASMFADEGVPVFDADAEVHKLYARGGDAVAPVEAAFPGVTRDEAIDRAALSARVLGDSDAIKRLEAIVHPLVGEARRRFLHDARRNCDRVAVLEIPLLFETGGDTAVDKIVVVSAPADVQRARVLARAGMSEQKLERILALQTPDSVKRERADFVIDTGAPLDETRAQVRAVLDAIREQA